MMKSFPFGDFDCEKVNVEQVMARNNANNRFIESDVKKVHARSTALSMNTQIFSLSVVVYGDRK